MTLEESLQHALSHNADLQIAREDLHKSRLQLRQGMADFFPQFDITLQYTRNHLLPTFFFLIRQQANNNLPWARTTTSAARSAFDNPFSAGGNRSQACVLRVCSRHFQWKGRARCGRKYTHRSKRLFTICC